VQGLGLDVLVEHADYGRMALLSALLLFPRGQFVRLVVALFAGLELAYALASGAEQARIIWTAVLLGLALVIFAAGVMARRGSRLTAEEADMAARLMKGMGRSRARHLIDQGYWLNGAPGEVLLRENEAVKQFCYLSSGEARVLMGGRPIGFCRRGDVVGGLGFFSGETAAATVVLATPARFWCAPAERLKPYFEAHPELKHRIERSLAEAPAKEAEPEPAAPLPTQAAVPAS